MEKFTRKEFLITSAFGVAALAVPGHGLFNLFGKKYSIGHTAITWGYGPENTKRAIRDVSTVGFYSLECFGGALEYWEERGGIGQLLKSTGLKLQAVYCPVNLLDSTRRKEQLSVMLNRGRLLKKYGGSVAVIGPDMVDRSAFNFNEHKADITATLDELARALADIGVTAALHQHKNSCIETRDELYSVMDSVDTRYVKLCPDFGHLYNGGMDPGKVVQDYLPLIAHVHIKDYGGNEQYNGFCPLGEGEIDIGGVLDILEKSDTTPSLMAELNPPPKNSTLKPAELITVNRKFLEQLGYTFHSGT